MSETCSGKRIVMILTNGFDPDVRVYKEARYLVQNGAHVTILCWDRNRNTHYPINDVLDGINIVRYRIPSTFGSGKKQIPAFLKFSMCCRQYLRSYECDYIHCNDLDGEIIGFITKKHNTPIVFDMHEYYEDVGNKHELKRKFMRSLTIFFIRRSFAALYENDLYLKEAYKAVQDKLFELKNYPDSLSLLCERKTESSCFRIGYHGVVRSQIAEFTTLFEAVKGMNDVRVDIHGGGPDYKKLLELSKNYQNVYVHGPFDGTKELTNLYANTDVVYAGYRPYSDTRECAEVVKFFECILTGTPIILTEAYTGMGDRINKLGLGITCDTLNVEAVKGAILKLKNDKQFWSKCSENEKKYSTNYDWNTEVRVLDKVYNL